MEPLMFISSHHFPKENSDFSIPIAKIVPFKTVSEQSRATYPNGRDYVSS